MTYCGKERPSLDSWQAFESWLSMAGHLRICGERIGLGYETGLSQEVCCAWQREGATVPSR